MKSNVFFNAAVDKASSVLGKKGRMIMLLAKLSNKLSRVDWKRTDAKAKLFVMGRMLKAYATGAYKELPWKSLLFITAAVIYFINPIDLVPDWLLGIGFSDDLAILMGVYQSVIGDINKFLAWEKLATQKIDNRVL